MSRAIRVLSYSAMISGPYRYLLENKTELERASVVNELNPQLAQLFPMVH